MIGETGEINIDFLKKFSKKVEKITYVYITDFQLYLLNVPELNLTDLQNNCSLIQDI